MATTTPLLRAIYTSPDKTIGTVEFNHHLTTTTTDTTTPAPVSSSAQQNKSTDAVKAKTAYLAELKNLATTLQSEINVFLTERMEEDKKAEEARGRKISEKESKEEENYGEEVAEDDS